MTHRERVLTAMRYQEPDRVPLFYRDVPEVDSRLQKDLGLKDREELLQFFDIDFRWVEPTYIGPPLSDDNTERMRDIWGIEYKYTKFSDQDGYWAEAGNPLADCDDVEALDQYPWPKLEWFDFSTLSEQVREYDEYAIMTAPGVASPGILQTPTMKLLGIEKSLIDMVLRPDFFRALVQRILDFQIPFIERMLEAAGGRIDFFRLGDDFGTQKGMLMAPNQWREFIQPALASMGEIAKKYGAYYYQHSCGAIRDLIPDFIETGVDVLDPLQVSAVGMNPAELKAEFGRDIRFSGGVDEQELLPRGTPDQVKTEVRSLLDTMAPGGGFFLGPTHNFQPDIPTENIVAMYEVGREWSY